MLSKSSKYALRAVLYIAVNASESKKIMAKEIAGPTNVPAAYIAKLLQELGRHGIVSSVKGPKGGFYLDDQNMQTRLIEIVDVIDGEERLRSCMLSIGECDSENPCPLHALFAGAKTTFIQNLEETTVRKLVREIEEGNSILPL